MEYVPFGNIFDTAPGTFQRWMKMIWPDDNFDYSEALIQFVLSNPLVDVVLIGM